MTIRNLDRLFQPRSVALIGASERAGSVGAVIMRNLLEGGFRGPVWPVNPRYATVAGVDAYPDVASLPETPDMAVIATPPATVPALVAALAERGTRAATVITAGLSRHRDGAGRSLQQAMLEAGQPYLFRILGPNCLGLLVPDIGLNASFAQVRRAASGRLAFVSQSGALCTAVLDWAEARGIGFSHFISIGDAADVDFGDIIDYLGGDPQTQAILLYIESVTEARKFMSAARAASRNKPIVAIKAGRVEQGQRAAASHTGAMAGTDDAYDAAFHRAGILRVDGVDELFEAVETLARSKRLRGERLAILTNGGGPGVLATDALIQGGGTLATLSPQTIGALDAVLPANWSRADPVDIVGDAPGERYRAAIDILLRDEGIDALLVMHAPTAIASSENAAQATIEAVRDTAKNVLTCWLGSRAVEAARRRFADAGLPTYETPLSAVRAFLHIAQYRRNQAALMETPLSPPQEVKPDMATVRKLVDRALGEDISLLSEVDAKAVFAAYGVPVVKTAFAPSVDDAVRQAEAIGYPAALKLMSPDISHKSDVGGVALDLENADDVRHAATAMQARVAALRPDARIEGFSVQAMARRSGAYELIVGAATDPIFGPVMLFGQGGKAVELLGDRAVALPPLNMSLAADLVSRTRIARLLAGYRDVPSIDHQALHLTLVRVAQLVADVPELQELEINPLFADARGVLAVDGRIRVAPSASRGSQRLAIRPYPRELEETATLASGRRVTLRPIRPEDEPAHRDFAMRLESQDIRFRFFGMVRRFEHSQLARMTQIDYDREMAFIATVPGPDGAPETLGVVRTVTDPDNHAAEFALIVRSDQQGQGIGQVLMDKMIGYCRGRGTAEMVGQILADNMAMRRLAKKLGFRHRRIVERGAIEVFLPLDRDGSDR